MNKLGLPGASSAYRPPPALFNLATELLEAVKSGRAEVHVDSMSSTMSVEEMRDLMYALDRAISCAYEAKKAGVA